MRFALLPSEVRWLLFCSSLATSALTGAETGTVKGHVPLTGAVVPIAVEKYTGKISGKVEPPPRPIAGVWLEAPSLRAQAAAKQATFEQRGYQFTTGLMIVGLGTAVVFPNLDPDYHNVFSLSKAKRFDLGRYKPDERPAPVLTFDKPGIVQLKCEIHEHMRGTIIVVDSPYFTRSDEQGNFTLTGIPPGTYTLRVWVNEQRSWEKAITVKEKRTEEVSLSPK